MIVGVFNTSCIDPFHVGKIDQRSNNWFYRFTSYSYHFLAVLWVLSEFLMHAVIVFLVNAVIYLFKLGAFATTLLSKWATLAITFAASVGALSVAFTICLFAFEKEFGLVASIFYTFVLL